jgi:hypothetical protein
LRVPRSARQALLGSVRRILTVREQLPPIQEKCTHEARTRHLDETGIDTESPGD